MTQEQVRQHLHLDYSRSWSDNFYRCGCRSRSRKPIHQHELDVFFLCSSWCTCPSSLNPYFSLRVFVHNDHLYSFSLFEVIHSLSFVFEVTLLFVCREPCTHWSSVRASHNCSSFGHDLTNASLNILSWSFDMCLYSCRTC
jgi:hypothetical protein